MGMKEAHGPLEFHRHRMRQCVIVMRGRFPSARCAAADMTKTLVIVIAVLALSYAAVHLLFS